MIKNGYSKIEKSESLFRLFIFEINFYFNQKLLIKIRGHNLITYR